MGDRSSGCGPVRSLDERALLSFEVSRSEEKSC